MQEYTDDAKAEIIKRILLEVNEKGSSRVGYHAQQVLGKDKTIPYNIKSKLEGTIVASRKYISRLHPNFKNDFEILVNPNYEEERENLEMQQLRSNNQLLVEQLIDFLKMKRQRNIAVIVAILSLIANVVLILVEVLKKNGS
jgi:hypothetical protein